MSRQRRIMMISTHGYVGAQPELGKPDTGGQVVYVLELSKCLARMGYHVDILTRRFEDQPAEESVARRVRVLRIRCGGNRFLPKETLCEHIPEWVSRAARYVTRGELHYEFISSHYWDAGLAGQALSRFLHIPHLHTPHSLGAWKRDNMAGNPQEMEVKYNFQRRIREERQIYLHCDRVLATTPEQVDQLTEGEYRVPEEKISILPPGYDDLRFFPISSASKKLLKQEMRLPGRLILALGRLAENKGYDLLIRAMPAVFQRIPDAHLLLAVGSTRMSPGERNLLVELRKLARDLHIQKRVLFQSYIPDDELASYYRAADVFALSSRYEPFGMTAIEAMACGTPTVVTTEGGLFKLTQWGQECLYANPFDPESFGHAITTLLQFPEVHDRLAVQGARKARENFTWTHMAQEILQQLETLSVASPRTSSKARKERDQWLAIGSSSAT